MSDLLFIGLLNIHNVWCKACSPPAKAPQIRWRLTPQSRSPLCLWRASTLCWAARCTAKCSRCIVALKTSRILNTSFKLHHQVRCRAGPNWMQWSFWQTLIGNGIFWGFSTFTCGVQFKFLRMFCLEEVQKYYFMIWKLKFWWMHFENNELKRVHQHHKQY